MNIAFWFIFLVFGYIVSLLIDEDLGEYIRKVKKYRLNFEANRPVVLHMAGGDSSEDVRRHLDVVVQMKKLSRHLALVVQMKMHDRHQVILMKTLYRHLLIQMKIL